MQAKEYFEFDPKKLIKVDINDVRPNTWNPKDPDDPDCAKVLESIRINGLTQPIFVRENDNGVTKYECLDGEHRLLSAQELGYKEIYVYNEGQVPDELAKSLTIWHEVGVKMQTELLAPLAMELSGLDFELPFSDREMNKFSKMTALDFDEAPIEDSLKTLTIKMTPEQFEDVNKAIELVSERENVSAGRALQLICANGVSDYPFDV